MATAGDLIAPIEAGLLDAGAILELGDVPTGAVAGRANAHQLTVFKSAGSAVLDALTAHKVYAADLTQCLDPGGSDQVWEGCVRGTHRFFRILNHRSPIGRVARITFGKDVCAGRTDSSGTKEVGL